MSSAEVDRHVAQRYQLKRRLGRGAYGVVWKAVDRKTGEVVAIKKIVDAFRDRTDAQRTFREAMLLRALGVHPNITRLLEVLPAQNDRDIYLVLESMDTDLNAVIQKGGLLDDVHQRYILCQLLWTSEYLHAAGVIHRDQKPSNVLLDARCSVKLCDFGLARRLGAPGPEGPPLTQYVATRWYRAPEVLLHSSRYSPGVDMWSLGCILGEMLRGRPLFPGASTLHQLHLILEAVAPPAPEDLSALGADDSVLALHNPRSRPRPSLEALLPADTPPDALDLLRRLLTFAPHRRLSASEALRHPYVRRFHCPERQWTCGADLRLPEPEGAGLSASEYRGLLYEALGLRRAARAPRPPRSPEQPPAPAPSLGRQPGRGLREARGAQGACVRETPPAPPSLVQQAEAQAANRVLVRSQAARGGGQVAPRPPRRTPGGAAGCAVPGSPGGPRAPPGPRSGEDTPRPSERCSAPR